MHGQQNIKRLDVIELGLGAHVHTDPGVIQPPVSVYRKVSKGFFSLFLNTADGTDRLYRNIVKELLLLPV